MSSQESSSRFCLFCYKNTENLFLDEADIEISEKTKRFTNVINACTNVSGQIKYLDDNLMKTFSKSIKVLNYCSDCDSFIDQLCDIYNQIKSLELQLDCKLDKLGNIINSADKVPSRWMNIKEHTQSDLGEGNTAAATQNIIQQFRQSVLNAVQSRLHNSQTTSSKQTLNISDNPSKSNATKKAKLKKKLVVRSVLPEQCPKCPMTFRSKKTLSVHLSHHKAEEEPIWECIECNRKFSRLSSFTIHRKSHTSGDKPFKCKFCAQSFIYLQPLKRHLRTEHEYDDEKGGTVVMTDCSDELVESSETIPDLTQNSNLDLNFSVDIQTGNEAIVIKQEPDSLLPDLEEDQNNVDIEPNGDSQYWWENTSIISSAIKQEVPEGPPPTQSSTQSTSKSTLKSKPIYECEICSKKFKYVLHKERHFKLFHDLEGNPEDTEAFNCELENCTAYFLKKTQLELHYNNEHQISARGLGEKEDERSKEYKCKKCGKKFANNVGFLDHISKFRFKSCVSFDCKVCGEEFRYLLRLNEHLSKEHGNEVVFKYKGKPKKNMEKAAEEMEKAAEEMENAGENVDKSDKEDNVKIYEVVEHMVDELM